MATHGLVAQGKATVARVNANRRDVRFGNQVIPTNFFSGSPQRPELSRLQWNPNAAAPYPASIRYRDLPAGQSGGGAGPHLNDPEDLLYLLRSGGVEHSFTTPASDETEPYAFNMGKPLRDWLTGLADGTQLDFAIVNTESWGARPTSEAFSAIPVTADADHLDGVVAFGFEVPALDLRYWSLDEDATIDGKTWIGDSRLSVSQQSASASASRITVQARVGPETVPDRGAILGNDVVVRWWYRRGGRWVRIPNTFPGKVANVRLSGLVMTLTIDPGPFPQSIDQRRFSNEDQQTFHPGDRFFEHAQKWKERPQDFRLAVLHRADRRDEGRDDRRCGRPAGYPRHPGESAAVHQQLLHPASSEPHRDEPLAVRSGVHGRPDHRPRRRHGYDGVPRGGGIAGRSELDGNQLHGGARRNDDHRHPDGGAGCERHGDHRNPRHGRGRGHHYADRDGFDAEPGSDSDHLPRRPADPEPDFRPAEHPGGYRRVGYLLRSQRLPGALDPNPAGSSGEPDLHDRPAGLAVCPVQCRDDHRGTALSDHLDGAVRNREHRSDRLPGECRPDPGSEVCVDARTRFPSRFSNRPEDADVPDHTIFLDGLSIPRAGNTYRIKTPPPMR